jgi:hypothetical protein
MLAAALDAAVPAAWAAGDEVYGADPYLRADLEARGVGYVLAVARDHQVALTTGTVRVDTIAASLPSRSCTRRRSPPLATDPPQHHHRRVGVLPRLRAQPGTA